MSDQAIQIVALLILGIILFAFIKGSKKPKKLTQEEIEKAQKAREEQMAVAEAKYGKEVVSAYFGLGLHLQGVSLDQYAQAVSRGQVKK